MPSTEYNRISCTPAVDCVLTSGVAPAQRNVAIDRISVLLDKLPEETAGHENSGDILEGQELQDPDRQLSGQREKHVAAVEGVGRRGYSSTDSDSESLKGDADSDAGHVIICALQGIGGYAAQKAHGLP